MVVPTTFREYRCSICTRKASTYEFKCHRSLSVLQRKSVLPSTGAGRI